MIPELGMSEVAFCSLGQGWSTPPCCTILLSLIPWISKNLIFSVLNTTVMVSTHYMGEKHLLHRVTNDWAVTYRWQYLDVQTKVMGKTSFQHLPCQAPSELVCTFKIIACTELCTGPTYPCLPLTVPESLAKLHHIPSVQTLLNITLNLHPLTLEVLPQPPL